MLVVMTEQLPDIWETEKYKKLEIKQLKEKYTKYAHRFFINGTPLVLFNQNTQWRMEVTTKNKKTTIMGIPASSFVCADLNITAFGYRLFIVSYKTSVLSTTVSTKKSITPPKKQRPLKTAAKMVRQHYRLATITSYPAGIAISVSLVLAMSPPPVWFTPPLVYVPPVPHVAVAATSPASSSIAAPLRSVFAA